MLEYKREDEARLIQNLILGECIASTGGGASWACLKLLPLSSPPDLKPKGVVVNMIPGLPAFLLFMCVRHADYLNDDVKLKSLMNGVIGAIKQVIVVSSGPRWSLAGVQCRFQEVSRLCDVFQSHQKDFELLSFWLANTYQLLNCLKQYSGEEVCRSSPPLSKSHTR